MTEYDWTPETAVMTYMLKEAGFEEDREIKFEWKNCFGCKLTSGLYTWYESGVLCPGFLFPGDEMLGQYADDERATYSWTAALNRELGLK